MNFSKHFRAAITYFFTSVLTTLAYPLTTTWDGYLYLGSGDALIHGKMQQQYHWLRDPLYPFLVGILNESGLAWLITFIQALFLIVGIHLFVVTFSNIMPGLKVRTILATLFTYLFVAGFAASLLQQALIVLLSGSLVAVVFRSRNASLKLSLVLILLFLLTLTSTVVALGGTLVFVSSVIFRPAETISKKLIAVIAAFVVVGTTFGFWNAYKSQYDSVSSFYQGQRYFWEMDSYNHFSIPDKILAIPSTFAALNSVGVEFYYDGFGVVGAESRLFGTPVLQSNEQCGRQYPGPEGYLSETKFNKPNYCANTMVFSIASVLNAALSVILPFVSLLGLIATIVLGYRFIRKRDFFGASALLSGQLLLVPFWIGNVAISRLGLVALVSNVALFFLICAPILEKFILQRRIK